MGIAASVLELVGGTPLLRLNRLAEGLAAEVVVKIESRNPGGSIKDRVALAMVEAAEREGRLRPGSVLVEPTSGNTGVGLALVGAARGYRVAIFMPESMSVERRRLLRALGAELHLTPATGGMAAAIEAARDYAARTPGALLLGQFSNPANPRAHELTTAEEIWRDTGGHLDALVAGVGTGGTLTGLARALKPRLPGLRVVAVEPASSAVLSGGAPGPHRIQGIGGGFVPELLDTDLIDEVIAVTDEEAGATARRLAREEGVLAGISSGAAVWAALRLAARPELRGGRVLAVLPDGGERYLSTWLYAEEAP